MPFLRTRPFREATSPWTTGRGPGPAGRQAEWHRLFTLTFLPTDPATGPGCRPQGAVSGLQGRVTKGQIKAKAPKGRGLGLRGHGNQKERKCVSPWKRQQGQGQGKDSVWEPEVLGREPSP